MIERIAATYRAVHQVLPDATMKEIRRALTDCGINAPASELVEDILAGRETGVFEEAG